MLYLFVEARLAVTALLRGTELVLKEGVVLCADYGKIVTHRTADGDRLMHSLLNRPVEVG